MRQNKTIVWLTVTIAVLALAGTVFAAASAINTVKVPAASIVSWWQVRDNTASAATAVELKTAPSTGQYLAVRRVIMSCASAIAIYLQDEDGNVIAGGYEFTTGGPGTIDIQYEFPRYLTDEKALHYQATGAGNVTIEVEGFTAS